MERTETLTIRMSKRERACLDAAAKDCGMTVSDYSRAGAMLMAMLDGNLEALKITANLAKEKFSVQMRMARHGVGAVGMST